MRTFSKLEDSSAREREIPLHTLEGVPDADIHVHPFTTQDGLGLSLHRFLRAPADDVVLLIHGLTTSSDMFIMPEHENLVRYLLDHGFSDVWTLDFRMSNRYPYNLRRHRYTLDDVAAFDFPAAVARLRQVVGDCRLHVICHCLGSVSFMMSLFGGAVEDISSVIANSAALTPRIPRWSQLKLAVAPFLLEHVLDMPYLDPNARHEPLLSRSGLLGRAVGLLHRECDEPACHMLSMMWGSGAPALYRHENLHPVTHRRGGDLYGPTSHHYYRHVLKMVRAGGAVKYDLGDSRLDHLPDNYFRFARDLQTPILLVTGEDNHVFTDSNVVCYRRLEALAPGRHSLEVIPGYGHQDVFMGKDCARAVFPRFLRFLEARRREHPLSRVAAR
ncbi:alpha/beta fold hydrolase [Archangium sp.]|uniref:alpha/beta fold hydrolase n=1 Tax=Archangium sp. TaxID=1872627 RepID=UPI002EDAD2E8